MKTIFLDGYIVEIHNFGYASFFYPEFNGNAEFKVNKKGFKELRHYLRTVNYFNRMLNKHKI
jgi:hypothetical protein